MNGEKTEESNLGWISNSLTFVLPLSIIVWGTVGWHHGVFVVAIVILVAGVCECYCNRPMVMLALLSRLFANGSFGQRYSGTKCITAGDFSFCYCEWGQQYIQSPSILFLHGTGESKFSWREVVKHISRHHHIVLLDLPGYGGTTCNPKYNYSYTSQADRVGQFVVLTGLWKTPFHLVGYSSGGTIAAIYASKHPNDVARLTLINPSGLCEDISTADSIESIQHPLQIASAYILPEGYLLPPNVYKVLERRYTLLQSVMQKSANDNMSCNTRQLLLTALRHIMSPTQIILCSKELHPDKLSVFQSFIQDCNIEVNTIGECGPRILDERPETLAKMIVTF